MLNKRILVLMFVVVFLLLVGCEPSKPNQAPIITSDPDTTATVGEAYTYDVEATDPDGDTLNYSLAVKPFGMTIHSLFGIISWDPQIKDVGDHDVIVKVTDGDLDITQSFIITVVKEEPGVTPTPPVNHAPVITTSPITEAVMGIAYLYNVDATDPDGDALTYSLTTNPSGMIINSNNGVIDWIPTAEGDYPVGVEVSDGALSDTQNFTITVKTVVITGIEVLPDEMTLVTGASETIQSVTALYEIKAADFEVPIPLGDCTYASDAFLIAKVSNDGVITAGNDGTANITVSYAGMTDTVEVTVVLPVHNIDTDEYYDTIQAAIDDELTLDGHTIEVAAGNYLGSTLLLTKSLTIQGAGKDLTVIDAEGAQYGIKIVSGVVLDYIAIKDLTVENVYHSNIVIYHTTVAEAYFVNLGLSGYEPMDPQYCAGLRVNGGTVTDWTVEGCTFENILIWGVDVDSGSTVGHLTVIDSDFSTTEDAAFFDGVWNQSGIESCGNIDELTVSGCTFTGMVNGIRLFWYWSKEYSIDNVDIEGSTFEGTDAGFLFYVPVGGYAIGDIQIHDCSFADNNWGVNFDDSGTGDVYEHVVIDATNNWWGSEHGPKHDGFPLDGGDAVSDNVDYSNWSIVPN